MIPRSVARRLSLVFVSMTTMLVACAEHAPDGASAAPRPSGGGVGAADASVADDGDTDAGGLRPDRFVTRVVSFTPGDCAGFGASDMPDVVLGPPAGAGTRRGSLDVVSLGIGGELVVSFEPNAIVDGPGVDFIVFENAFYAAGNPDTPAADPGEISVSEDGVTWTSYACPLDATAPYGTCAGWHPVFSAPDNGISPVDPSTAGGEAYDLAELGLSKVRFVRIRDRSSGGCEGQPKPVNLGFDLDAIAIVNAELP